MQDPRYPIGKYEPQPYSEAQKKIWLQDIQFLPQLLELAIEKLSDTQLNTPYRDGGWTVRQLVHHVADSHMNAYIRFRLGLTETNPTIRPYDEKEWALLADIEKIPVNISITLLYALHTRWHATIRDLSKDDWMSKTVVHPEHGKQMTLWHLLGMYAWHGKHHLTHVTALKEKMGWQEEAS
ncbi:MAG: hypothetical protein RLZZ316_206 [Bacteroidota bacterium]|jgi:uncharacterized damage-inducible protein DinB